STASTGTGRHGPPGHGGAAVPCRVVPPCRHPGPGTALRGRRRDGPCPWARKHGRPERRRPGRTMAGKTVAAAQATGGGDGGPWRRRRGGRGRAAAGRRRDAAEV